MDEQLLVDFLNGRASAAELGRRLLAAQVEPESPNFRSSAHYRVTPLAVPVVITIQQVERLVAAAEAGSLTEEQIGIAVFLLEASPDSFQWDTDTPEGNRIANVLFWLGSWQINYPLTRANLAAFRQYLATGAPFDDEDPRQRGA